MFKLFRPIILTTTVMFLAAITARAQIRRPPRPVPELGASSAATALACLGGVVLLLSGRKKK